MKQHITSLALTLGLALGASTSALANERPMELAGVTLGMDVKEAIALIKKNHPEYDSELKTEDNFGGTTNTTYVFRKLNPDATKWSNQEFGSIAITAIDETGQVYSISRGERVEEGSMKLKALEEAAEAQFGKIMVDISNTFIWNYGNDACRSLSARQIGVPGHSSFDTRYFNMRTQQYVNASTLRSVNSDCDYVARMKYEARGRTKDVVMYSTTIANPSLMAVVIDKNKAAAHKPTGDTSGVPKF